jgi:hypothetical protein
MQMIFGFWDSVFGWEKSMQKTSKLIVMGRETETQLKIFVLITRLQHRCNTWLVTFWQQHLDALPN